jgi:paired amphipathic helix protein Sin3a
MGIHVKASDKKNLNPKHLVDTIKTKHEEQRRQRSTKGRAPKHQFSYEFHDLHVIVDVLRCMILYTTNSGQINNSGSERRRICEFFEKIISTFFEIPIDLVADRTSDIDRGTPEDDLDDGAVTELPNGRGRRAMNGKKTDLRRGVLDRGRNGNKGRGQKDDSASGSKESTPDVDSMVEDDVAEGAEDQAVNEVTNERWAAAPGAVATTGTRPLAAEEVEMKADQPFKREWYSLYSNQNIYVFFSIFQTLYRRFKEIKDSEEDAVQEGLQSRMPKPAKDIGLIDEKNEIPEPAPGETYYSKTLLLVDDLITNEIEQSKYEDFLRRHYLKKGWQLYTLTDLLKSLCRLGGLCASQDTKEKTPDLIEQFYHDRESKETSFNTEINLRKQADKYIKDGELFLIRWVRMTRDIPIISLTISQIPRKSEATIQWIQKDETTFDLDDMERKERWQYYTSSFVRIEPTEGVNRGLLHKSVLTRNLPSGDVDSEDSMIPRKPLVWSEDLTLRICVNSSRIIFKEPGSEYFIYTDKPLTWDDGKNMATARVRLLKAEESRNERFKQKWVNMSPWMKDLPLDEVQRISAEMRKWITDGVLPGTPLAVEEVLIAQ